MYGAIDILSRMSAILFALGLLGSSFLLWSRSKSAALLGAGAGAAALFFEFVFIGLGTLTRSMSPHDIQLLFSASGVLQALVTYVPLAIAAFLLARRKTA